MKEQFIEKNFRPATLAVINKANEILSEYDAQGLVLTLRQLYYQFVARGIIANKQTEYDRLGGIISSARLAGLIDWNMMEDRTRMLRGVTHWGDPASIVDAVAQQYKEDLWASQSNRCEVWIEKDALVGVIEGVCRELRVDYFACRGYASQSAQYEAGQRFRRYRKAGQQVTIFHLGDHDPSGIDMTRDNNDRINMFALDNVIVKRLALNMNQVRQYNPPPNPAKESDSRGAGYIAKYGNESWELDALEPSVISTLIRSNVEPLISNRAGWKQAQDKEQRNQNILQKVSTNWDSVKSFMEE